MLTYLVHIVNVAASNTTLKHPPVCHGHGACVGDDDVACDERVKKHRSKVNLTHGNRKVGVPDDTIVSVDVVAGSV